MTTFEILFEILMVIFAGLAVLGGLTALTALYLTRRNSRNNQQGNQQPNLCNGPVPVDSNINIPAQTIPITTYSSICNRWNSWPWIIASIVGGVILILFLTRGYSTSSNDTTQIVPPPAPVLDPKTVVDPINGKIDESTKLLAGKIDSVNQNLTAHRESSKRGYVTQSKKLDDIKAGVNANGSKLDEVKKQLTELDASITSLRGELSTKVNDLKTALTDSANAQKINSLTDEINQLRARIENLEKQKNLIGDPD